MENNKTNLYLTIRKKLALRVFSLTTAVLMVTTQMSCHYYKVTQEKPDAEKINQLKNAPNFIFLHQLDKAWNMTDIVVNSQDQTITGTLGKLPHNRIDYLFNHKDGRKNVYNKYQNTKKPSNKYVLDEVHIYLKQDFISDVSSGIIPITAIERIDVYDPDTGKTIASHIIGGVIAVGAVLAIVAIVLILTKSSCPFIYHHDGDSFQFIGEIYSGALYGCLERDDYLLLPSYAPNGFHEIKIANKLKERQFTNLLELWQVEHPVGVTVAPDRYGNVLGFNSPQHSGKAVVNLRDVGPLLEENDGHSFLFDEREDSTDVNRLILTFKNPNHAKKARLLVRAKNSMWVDYLYGEFTKYFGSSYDKWIRDQRDASPQEHIQWMHDQSLALKVFVQSGNGWTYQDYFASPGPLAERDIAMEINLPESDNDEVKIKFETGFMFWELNSISLDYSSDKFEPVLLNLESAINQDGKDVSASIHGFDKFYLEQRNVGDETILKYQAKPTRAGMQKTVILHAAGYYEHMREFEGLPDLLTLRSFKKPGTFPRFSRDKFEEMERLVTATPIAVTSAD